MTKIHSITLANFRRFYEGTKRRLIEIEFPEEFPTIMIVGDNGMGKTTLASELNLLPSLYDSYDIIEGEIGEKTVLFSHNGSEYKLTYIYRPNGKTHSCSADLTKIENGKRIQLSSTSSVTEVRNIIKKITGIDTKLIKLTSLSADERGIVNMKAGARREYIQTISPIGDTKELIKTISEKHSFFKRSREANELKLSNMPNYDTLVANRQNLIHQRDNLNKKLNSIQNEKLMDETEYFELRNEINEIEKCLTESDKMINVLRDNKIITTLDMHNKEIEVKIGEQSGYINMLMGNIASAQARVSLSTIRNDVSLSDLKEQLESHEFHKIVGPYLENTAELSNLSRAYSLIQDILQRVYDNANGIPISEILDSNPTNELLELQDIYFRYDREIGRLENEKSKNYVSDNRHLVPSSKCVDPKCELRLEFDNMTEKLTIYNSIIDKLSETKRQAKLVESRLEKLTTLTHLQTDMEWCFKTVEDNKDTLRNISSAFNSINSFKEYIREKGVLNFDDNMISISYNTKVWDSYKNLKQDYEIMSNNKVNQLKSDIEKWQKDLNAYTSIKSELESKLIRVVSNRYTNYYANDLIKLQKELTDKLTSLKIKLNTEDKKREEYEAFKDIINNTEKEMNTLNEEIDKVNFDMKLYEHIEEELAQNIKDEQDAFKIKETLTKHLPIKVMRRLMLNLKDITNSFLELTDMPYRIFDFEVTPKEFTIKVQKDTFVKEDISKMSDGEKSIMSLATTLALNTVMLPEYNIFILDEMDATLSKENKRKFLDMVDNFARIKDLQIFAISHNEYYNASNSESIGIFEMKPDGELKVIPFSSYI